MLYYDINYYYNRFFLINKYYIYIYVTNNNHKYEFRFINNKLELTIHKKNHKKEVLRFKIMCEDNESVVNLKINYKSKYEIDINNLIFTKSLLNIDIINKYFEYSIEKVFPNFDTTYYMYNNRFIDNNNLLNINFIKSHWYFCGQYNPYFYYKYLLKKYEDIINNLVLNISSYDDSKNNTLLFVDDRYDPSFIYLLKLFLYSVDESWNVTIFTIESNILYYEKDLDLLKIKGKIFILENKLNNNHDYSNLLKDYNFWNKIREENVLIFQYDSFCMGKFNNIFLNYNYIGARWPHNPLNNKLNCIGNGGTSFRKTRTMEYICKKHIKSDYIEDLFFSYYLFQHNLHNCSNDIADLFSFENIFCENSIYAHQIYNTISLEDLDNFMYKKITNMLIK